MLGWLQSIIAGLHANGQRFVPIVEPVVHISPGYSVYDTGNQQGVFMKDVLGDNYVGQASIPAAAVELVGGMVQSRSSNTAAPWPAAADWALGA